MWAASKLPPYVDKVTDWEKSAQSAVVKSSNQATSLVWDACGKCEILQELTKLTNLPWLEQDSAASWGVVKINAYVVAISYSKMFGQISDDLAAQKIYTWMQGVVPSQTFGLKGVVGERFELNPSKVAVKCGWFLDEDETRMRTHAVTATKLSSGEIVGTVVLTAFETENQMRRTYKDIYSRGDAVISLHEELAGSALRTETKRMLDLAISTARVPY